MGADLTINGVDEIMAWADRTGGKVGKAIGPALVAGAEPILDDLKRTTAYVDRSGRLRKSMKISRVKTKRGKRCVWVGDVAAKALYAWPLERGSSRAKAHPFMRPAFERRKDEAYQRVSVKIKEAISSEP